MALPPVITDQLRRLLFEFFPLEQVTYDETEMAFIVAGYGDVTVLAADRGPALLVAAFCDGTSPGPYGAWPRWVFDPADIWSARRAVAHAADFLRRAAEDAPG